MESFHPFEVSGYILKVEKLTSIRHHILEGTLVFESSQPYPGYFGENLPDTEKPRSIFLVLKEKSTPEQTGRWIRSVKKPEQHACQANYAELIITYDHYYCIRIKGLDCFANIGRIQKSLQHEEVKFGKYSDIDQDGLIKVYKTFLVTEDGHHIYHDLSDPDTFYFPIPVHLNWNDFLKITQQVKNNIDNRNFDAALGILFRYEGLEDIVRIYNPAFTEKRTLLICALYLEAIRHYSAF